MVAREGTIGDRNPVAPIQDFIFLRELCEVYLLLDHVSGRWDKTLTVSGTEQSIDKVLGGNWLEKICEIGWPPTGTELQRAEQAAILLRAKDQLNAAAKPASGATIAFTLMVSGEDNVEPIGAAPASRLSRLLQRLGFDRGSRAGPGPSTGLPGNGGAGGGPPPPGGNGGQPPPGWGGNPPSRLSLARGAYPGLLPIARRFTRWTRLIIALLLVWLILTCVLSWNVTAGHSIFSRFDTLQTSRTEILSHIATLRSDTSTNVPGRAGQDETVRAEVGRALVAECRWPYSTNPATRQSTSLPTSSAEDLCAELADNSRDYEATRINLADWLATWRWIKTISHHACGQPNGCLKVEEGQTQMPEDAPNEQWGAILLEVLSIAVLPLFYGFLGAGAAVVRGLWGKMRDSLLAPRDLTLALGQLALGAVIGACIGLFVTPSPGGSGQQANGLLTGTVALTASALSFVAGFGVEGVFVALEGFIRRVFSLPDASKKS